MTEPLLAVVVGGTDLGEAHRVVRLLSAPEGRVSVLARHARRSRKRFAGLLELGTILRVHRVRGRGELAAIGDLDLVRAPRCARTEIERIAMLAWGCELCSALAPEQGEAAKLYRLLEVWLELLEGEERPGLASRVALEAKALTFAGLAPALLRCAACGERLEAPVVFDLEAGGALHGRCGGGRPVSVTALIELEQLRRTPLAETPGHPQPALAGLLGEFVRHSLGRELRSRGLVDDLERG